MVFIFKINKISVEKVKKTSHDIMLNLPRPQTVKYYWNGHYVCDVINECPIPHCPGSGHRSNRRLS